MSSATPRLSVVVPCFDEQERVGATIADLRRALDRVAAGGWEVIVVDDRSTDDTRQVAAAAIGGDARFRLEPTERGKGKGAAVRSGVLAARAEAVLVVDADLAADLEAVPAMMALLAEGADAVLGSRVSAGAVVHPRRPWLRRAAAAVYRGALRRLIGLRATDPQCGMKLYRADVVRPFMHDLETDGYAYETEVLLALQCSGARLMDHPVRWSEQPGSKVRVGRDGLTMLRDSFRTARRVRRRLRA